MVYPKYGLGRLLLRGAGGIFVFLMVIGTVFVLFAGSSSLRAMRLEEEGVDVAGVITGLETTQHSCGKKNRNTCTSYWVSYTFTPKGGAVVQGRRSVDAQLYARQFVGQALAVRYVAGAPELHEIERGKDRTDSWIMLTVGCAMWLGVGLFGPGHVRAGRRALYLREHGQMLRTRVSGVRDANIKVNRQARYRIVWDTPRGESWAAKRENLPAVGDEITVFAHPEGLWPPVWEGDVGSR